MQVDERPGICYVCGMAGLTLRQEKFVEAVTTPNTPTYCKPSAAYRAISPTIEPASAWQGASRLSRNVEVQAAIKGQLGIGQLGSKLKKCLRETEKLKDWGQVRETVMDYAKLTGQLVEKREQVNIDGASSSLIRDLVSRSMRSSTLPMGNTDGDAMHTPAVPATLPSSAATVKAHDDSTNAAMVNQQADTVANG